MVENTLDFTVNELMLKNCALENAMTNLTLNFYLYKIEAGKMEVYLEEVSIEKLLKELEIIVMPLMQNNCNTFHLICSPEIENMVTDIVMLRQSLLNLLSNAAKFTLNGSVNFEIM